MMDQDVRQVIAESLANTAAGAQHDHQGSTNHRLYRLPAQSRATIYLRVDDIVNRLQAAGFRVERVLP